MPSPTRGQALRAAAPGALIAFVVAGVFVVLGRYRVPIVLVAIGVLSLVLAVVAPRASRWFDRQLARFGAKVGRGVMVAAAAVGAVLVVLPLWLLNRAARADPLDDGWGRDGSAWRRRPDSHRPDGQIAGTGRLAALEHPTGPAKRGARLRRAGLAAVGVGAVVALVAVAGAPGGDDSSEVASPEVASTSTASASPQGDSGDCARLEQPPVLSTPDSELKFGEFPVTSYAHEDEPWIYDYMREALAVPYRWDPFLGGRLTDFEGEYINIRNCRRVSYQPPEPELTVWYFGGSTMYGVGQRDDHTIPSQIARLAEADGISIRSENFGVSSWVNRQETMYLEELLRTREAPDLIVFYDGENDAGQAWQRLAQGDRNPDHDGRLTVSEEEAAMLDRSYPKSTGEASDDDVVELAARQYERGYDRGRELAADAGVPIVHFWQPVQLSKDYAPADQELFETLDLDTPAVGRQVSQVFERILAASDTGAIDVTDALDDVAVPVYFDSVHTNEYGASVVAGALYRHLKPRLEEAVSPGS